MSEKTEHTSGPWRVMSRNLIVSNFDSCGISTRVICRQGDCDNGATIRGKDWESVARLIAAAPKLLKALESLIRANRFMTDHYDFDAELIKCEKIVAEAKGEGS